MNHVKSIKCICLFTATGAENLGDELIMLCEVRRFRAEFPGVHIVLFSHSPARTKRFLVSQNCSLEGITLAQYFPDDIRGNLLRNITLFYSNIRLIASADRVYIGGGGLFYSAREEGHSPLRLWWFRAYLIRLLRKPIFYHALGISASYDELLPFARGLFHNADITVRDTESQDLLLKLGYPSRVIGDPVFAYQTATSQKKKQTAVKTIGLALRSGFLSDETMESLVRGLLKKGYDVLFLPHSLHPRDERSHDGYYLQQFMYGGVRTTQSIEQTLAAYDDCDAVIAMRLHSIILSLVLKKPFVAVSYAKKTRSILEANNVSYFSPEKASADALIDAIEKFNV